jgi:hypothetical protein
MLASSLLLTLANVTSSSSLEPSPFSERTSAGLRDYWLEVYVASPQSHGPSPPCLSILLSDLTFDHDLAAVSASRCHYYATGIKLSSNCFALGRFGYRLIASPF